MPNQQPIDHTQTYTQVYEQVGKPTGMLSETDMTQARQQQKKRNALLAFADSIAAIGNIAAASAGATPQQLTSMTGASDARYQRFLDKQEALGQSYRAGLLDASFKDLARAHRLKEQQEQQTYQEQQLQEQREFQEKRDEAANQAALTRDAANNKAIADRAREAYNSKVTELNNSYNAKIKEIEEAATKAVEEFIEETKKLNQNGVTFPKFKGVKASKEEETQRPNEDKGSGTSSGRTSSGTLYKLGADTSFIKEAFNEDWQSTFRPL